MITHDTVLVQLIRLIERIPSPPTPPRRPRGRPIFYSEKLFLKALVIMIVRRLHRVGELLAVLEEPTPEMRMVRELLREKGRFPARRTFERRLEALPGTLPEQIGCLGRHLVELLSPWEKTGRAVALDSTPLRAKGGVVWHKKDREAARVPHTSTHFYRHRGGLDQVGLARVGVWVEAAPGHHRSRDVDPARRPAHPSRHGGQPGSPVADRRVARRGALRGGGHPLQRPERTRGMRTDGAVLGHLQKRGAYPHTDAGVEVRRIFHKLRSFLANENFNEHFKAIFDVHEQVPTKGRVNTARFALGAVFVYQLALLHRHRERKLEVNRGLKAFLRAA